MTDVMGVSVAVVTTYILFEVSGFTPRFKSFVALAMKPFKVRLFELWSVMKTWWLFDDDRGLLAPATDVDEKLWPLAMLVMALFEAMEDVVVVLVIAEDADADADDDEALFWVLSKLNEICVISLLLLSNFDL